MLSNKKALSPAVGFVSPLPHLPDPAPALHGFISPDFSTIFSYTFLYLFLSPFHFSPFLSGVMFDLLFVF